ncbi:unnamed protein product [Linum tenue]|uniref:TF-B3 domain-containing protein n=1 Tax=Linum tenue TaxID=586396 RepID=A0AAV0R9Z1_9ROSI|nr:unnamed protein product [Linum tenue]
MTSSGDRSLEDPGSSLVAGTHFVKIILHATLRDEILLIPGRFVRTYGESLSTSATLKVPSGATWTVDVVRDEIGVWFSNGWGEFAESHSLEFGHFLVFEYEGCSRFSVVICDRTGAEIAYPIRTTCEANLEETEDFFGAGIRKRSESLSEVTKPQVKNKMMVMRGSISSGNAAKMGSWSRIVLPTNGFNSSRVDDEQEDESTRTISEEPSRSRKCRVSTGFTSPHPFFEVQITPSMSKRQMHVPHSFSSSHIAQDEKAVQIQVRDGNSWSLALIRKKRNKYVMFGGGWDRFMKDNSVKPGDICIFECLRRWTNVLMQVTIVKDV